MRGERTATTTTRGSPFRTSRRGPYVITWGTQIFDIEDKGHNAKTRVSVLVDSGVTHNFIDAQMVQRRGITTEEFEGFSVLVLGDMTM